jgi:NitT/TauT family transport system substrate-binding protein
VGTVRQQPEVLAAVANAYAQSLAWCRAHPLECGAMMAQHIDLLTPEAVADAIAVSQLDTVPAAAARPELEFFLGQLMARNPALVGGKLPASAFYGMP